MAVHMEVSSRENRAAALTWVKSRPRHPRRPNGTTRSAISEIALDQCPLAGKSQAVDRAEPTPVRSATEAMMADTQIEARPAPPARAAPAAARRDRPAVRPLCRGFRVPFIAPNVREGAFAAVGGRFRCPRPGGRDQRRRAGV